MGPFFVQGQAGRHGESELCLKTADSAGRVTAETQQAVGSRDHAFDQPRQLQEVAFLMLVGEFQPCEEIVPLAFPVGVRL